MALSANAMKTLDQVKMGLLKLYGADYFTEEEFIKIDYLIHKGEYLFTTGPPKNLYDENLMSFDESPDDMKPVNMPIHTIPSFEPSKNDKVTVTEEQISSPGSSEGTDSLSRLEETPNATSLEASSDDEAAPPIPSTADAAPMFDFSESTAPIPSVKPSEPTRKPQTNNGLPPGITQAQLDEARAMQAAMTKAGKKGRPKYESYEESIPESAVVEPFQSEQAFPSPAPTERHTRISSWASQVNTQQDFSQPEIAAPTPIQKAVDLAALTEEYIKIHGRKPKNLNDIYQPNNPAHFSNRSGSVTSNTTTKTAKTTKTTKTAVKNIVKIGSTYVAQSSQFKSSHILVDVKAGDHIKVIKYVSGIQWLGTNLRTKLSGQFSEDVFKSPTTQTKPIQNISSRSAVNAEFHRGLETVEDLNASEWNEVPVTSRPKSVAPAPAPAPVRPALGGGLASSRFSALADREEPKPQPSQIQSNQHLTAAQIKEFGKIVDEKVDEILKARGMAPTPAPAAVPQAPSRSRGFNEPLKPVPPKANTCWFWGTGKGCRFTSEECRDLHAHLPSSAGQPTNLHMGKPTWGALADHTSPTIGHADPATIGLPLVPGAIDAASTSSDPRAKGLTCWYWARDGQCNYSAEDCKYAHEHTPKGVAPRPWQKLPSWGSHTWKRKEDGVDNGTGWGDVRGETATDAGGDRDGELVLQEVNGDDTMSVGGWGVIGDGGAGGWGRDTPVQGNGWGIDDRYKPPHVKALEEQARKEATGW